MKSRYRIASQLAPPRFTPIARFHFVRSDECANCGWCAQKACIFDVHARSQEDVRSMADTVDYLCKNCFRCIQECPREALTKVLNPAFLEMGDDYYTPPLISQTWFQAETGRVPVLGAGYRGAFSGPGFDRMWTDMSEIVRPTRDGIHGREHISTAVDLGRRPLRLEFDPEGNLLDARPGLVVIPLPVLLQFPSFGPLSAEGLRAWAQVAREVDTLALMPLGVLDETFLPYAEHIVPQISGPSVEGHEELLGRARMVEVEQEAFHGPVAEELRRINPSATVAVRVPFAPGAEDVVEDLVARGCGVIHLQADLHGLERGSEEPRFLIELIRSVHERLVELRVRDGVSLVVGGGIASAEHVPKAIICGADAVAVDVPLLVALECRLCYACLSGGDCPVEIEAVESGWAAQRLVNLMVAWRDQLLEVLGAMGMREVRRLRGEMGRAIFFRDAEEEAFGPIFRREAVEPSESLPCNDQGVPSSVVVRRTPLTYRNALGKYRVVRSDACIGCGMCARVCPYGVHQRPDGLGRTLPPHSGLCIGFDCAESDHYCVDKCPRGAISIELNPMQEALGDRRWTSDLIFSTWYEAETGEIPDRRWEHRVGDSGGGFDLLRFPLLEDTPLPEPAGEISTAIELNRREEGGKIRIPIPIYGGGMSFGSIGLSTMLARAKAAKAWGTFISTGEGGYPEALAPYDDHIITQVATGLFGVSEETIQRVRFVEFKYAQGAKPGLGGHLLGAKNTPAVAQMREAVSGTNLFSPFPFHSVYSVEDHKKHLDWVRSINPDALIAVKVSTPTDVDMVAVGSYYAGANILNLDGGYGGTGAAPEIAKKNIAMPLEYAIPKVHRFLESEGIRDEMVLIASGGIRTAHDIAKAIALGADGVAIGTAELVALGCVRCGNCESGRGCPRGIATTDPELVALIDAEWGAQRIINLYAAWRKELVEMLRALGLRSIGELRGRTDLLIHLRPVEEREREGAMR